MIIFISSSKRGKQYYDDPSVRYRCIFPAEELRNAGLHACVVHIDQLEINDLDRRSIAVFHRPNNIKRLKKLLSHAKARGIRCIVDFDDLIFLPSLAHLTAAVLSGAMTADQSRKFAEKYYECLRLFDEAIVSTQPLARWVKTQLPNSNIYILPNRLPRRWYFQHSGVKALDRFSAKKLRYLPGTSHHNGDFKQIEAVIETFLQKHPEVTLEIIGPLRFELSAVPDSQVTHLPAVPFEALAGYMADSWVCIAPLESTAFNECKSGLKFWESGLYGIPLVASPLADYERFENDGLKIASTNEQWLTALESLCDEQHYLKASSAAQESALSALQKSKNSDYLNTLGLAGLTLEHKDNDSLALAFDCVCKHQTKGLTEHIYYQVQEQYLTAWLGRDWLSKILLPKKPSDIKVVPELWGINNRDMSDHEDTAVLTPNKVTLPLAYRAAISDIDADWNRWVRVVHSINLQKWQLEEKRRTQVWVRKVKKLLRSPRQFLVESKLRPLRWLGQLLA